MAFCQKRAKAARIVPTSSRETLVPTHTIPTPSTSDMPLYSRFQSLLSTAWCSDGTTTFPEEPLLKTLEQGAGFFPGQPGLVLGNGKYRILRKLGWGQHSSTWLVDGFQCVQNLGKSPYKCSFLMSQLSLRFTPKRYFAVKILTAEATHSHHAGYMHELELLDSIKDIRFRFLPCLRDDFELSGPHGQHLCLVMDLLGTSVQTLRMSTPTKTLPVHGVKMIVALLIESLIHLHKLGIVHTGEITLFYLLWSEMLMMFLRHQGR
jgi:serine/threonine protein kinase